MVKGLNTDTTGGHGTLTTTANYQRENIYFFKVYQTIGMQVWDEMEKIVSFY